MLTYNVKISDGEFDLINAVRRVGFGEIYGAEIKLGEPNRSVALNANERALIMEIRNGLQYIDVIHVHEKKPVYIEIDEKINGFCTRKKIKLPTEITEGC
jgi:hypothetical protein